MHDGLYLSDADLIAAQTFPVDFDFCGRVVQPIVGMSVPPFMMYHIASVVGRDWLNPPTARLPDGQGRAGKSSN